MTYKVNVVENDEGIACFAVTFNKFREYCDYHSVAWWKLLSEYNGRNVDWTEYIEFETEEDAVVFKLKFG